MRCGPAPASAFPSDRGAFTLLKVRLKVLRTAEYGSRKPAKVRAVWSGDGTRVDLVKAVVKVVR